MSAAVAGLKGVQEAVTGLDKRVQSLEAKLAARGTWDVVFRLVLLPVSFGAGALLIGHEVRVNGLETAAQTRQEANKAEARLTELMFQIDKRLIRIEEKITK